MMNYRHQEVEAKWQKRWEEEKLGSAMDAPTTPSRRAAGHPSSLGPPFGGASPPAGRAGRRGRNVYVLDMFPYPSSDGLHVGHPEGYTASDIVARYLRMKGKNVLHPMGWDAFGLPAENAAIKKGVHPAIVTEQNVKNFKRQIQSLGFSYDWSREINTTDPGYYKWTQWIFLQLFKRGLAYEAELPIWWCPKDKTGLANEEVVNGCCERCGTPVERKMLRQWVLKITAYAERLISGLVNLDWPDSIKTLQRNWIGRSEGAEVEFEIVTNETPDQVGSDSGEKIVRVFTTRPDTLFGATYLVLSPEHPLVDEITSEKQKKVVEKYKKQVANKSDLERTALEKEKTGVFTGAYAVNPVNNEKIPVWIADYVLMSYGTGAIMAVPAHDERDFAFAKKFKLPIVKVIKPPSVMPQPFYEAKVASPGGYGHLGSDIESECWTSEGTMVNSGKFDDLPSEEGRKKIVEWLAKEGKAKATVQYKLRDWVFSRQRYWGEPIPLVHCDNCKKDVEGTKWTLNFFKQPWRALQSGEKTVETRALNPDEPDRYFGDVKEGDVIKCVLKDTTEVMYLRVVKCHAVKNLEEPHERKDLLSKLRRNFNPTLSELKEFYALTPDYVDRIQKNGLVAWEIEHVIPGVVPWEELPLTLPDVEKYEPTGTGESPLAAIKDWVNAKCPHCGKPAKRETNTMPQWAGSCWYYIRFCDPHNDEAMASPEAMKAWLPVDLYVGGAEHAVLHLLYARFWHMVLYDVGAIPPECGDEPFMKLKNQGLILGPDGEKMSKSRGNVINPDDIIEKYGADTLRMYEMFIGPFEDAKPWSAESIVGVRRFLERVWLIGNKLISELGNEESVPNRVHKYTKSATDGIQEFRFNTCVSDLMKWSNEWKDGTSRAEFETFLRLLAPFAPHIAEELWSRLGHKTLLAQEKWPEFDPKKVKEETVTIAVQVMGKLRGTITVSSGASQSEVETLAKAEPNVAKYLKGKLKKVIFVPDKLINFVV